MAEAAEVAADLAYKLPKKSLQAMTQRLGAGLLARLPAAVRPPPPSILQA